MAQEGTKDMNKWPRDEWEKTDDWCARVGITREQGMEFVWAYNEISWLANTDVVKYERVTLKEPKFVKISKSP